MILKFEIYCDVWVLGSQSTAPPLVKVWLAARWRVFSARFCVAMLSHDDWLGVRNIQLYLDSHSTMFPIRVNGVDMHSLNQDGDRIPRLQRVRLPAATECIRVLVNGTFFLYIHNRRFLKFANSFGLILNKPPDVESQSRRSEFRRGYAFSGVHEYTNQWVTRWHILTWQVGEYDLRRDLALNVLLTLMQPIFHQKMRTEQQLGYIVYCSLLWCATAT